MSVFVEFLFSFLSLNCVHLCLACVCVSLLVDTPVFFSVTVGIEGALRTKQFNVQVRWLHIYQYIYQYSRIYA